MDYQDISMGRLDHLAVQWHDPERSGYTYCLSPTNLPPKEAELPEDVAAAIKASETGAIVFWGPGETRLVLPPFPVESDATLRGWDVGVLQSLMAQPRKTLVVLLRLSGFAIGFFHKDHLVQSKTGTLFVKGRHRKGGSSSARFARRHEEQARNLFDKTCRVLREEIETYAEHPDHLLLGGDRLTLLAFEKRCPFLSNLEGIRLHRILNVERPSLRVLKTLPDLMYTSRVLTLSP